MSIVVLYGVVCFALGALTAPVWPALARRVRRRLRPRSAWADYFIEGRDR